MSFDAFEDDNLISEEAFIKQLDEAKGARKRLALIADRQRSERADMDWDIFDVASLSEYMYAYFARFFSMLPSFIRHQQMQLLSSGQQPSGPEVLEAFGFGFEVTEEDIDIEKLEDSDMNLSKQNSFEATVGFMGYPFQLTELIDVFSKDSNVDLETEIKSFFPQLSSYLEQVMDQIAEEDSEFAENGVLSTSFFKKYPPILAQWLSQILLDIDPDKLGRALMMFADDFRFDPFEKIMIKLDAFQENALEILEDENNPAARIFEIEEYKDFADSLRVITHALEDAIVQSGTLSAHKNASAIKLLLPQ